jgi:hypothetical protein
MRVDPDCRDPDLLAAEVRRLRAVIDSGAPVVAHAEPGELSDATLVANLLALADWQESDDLAAILRTAASRLNALAAQYLTGTEREALRAMLRTIMYEPDREAIESILARLG